MAFDHFTVRGLASELETSLQGKRIVDARSAGVAKSPGDRSLSASLAFTVTGADTHVVAEFGPRPVLCTAPGPIPAHHSRSEGTERYLRGALIDSVAPDARDRIVRIRLAREDEEGHLTYGLLVVELVTPHALAVLIGERSGQVFGCWRPSSRGARARRIVTGEPYPPLSGRRLLPGDDPCSAFLERLQEEDPGATIDRAIRSCMAGADVTLVADVLTRAEISADRCLGELEPSTLSSLWQVASARYSEGGDPGAFCWMGEQGPMFSVIRPNARLSQAESLEQFHTVSAAIGRWRELRADRDPKSRGQLRRALKSTRRTIQAVERDLERAEQADDHEKKGSILLSQIANVPAAADVVELTDTYSDASASPTRAHEPASAPTIQIELDPRTTPAENAGRYLKSAAKLRRRVEVLPQRLQGLKAKEQLLLDSLARLDQGQDLDPDALLLLVEQTPHKGSSTPKNAGGDGNARPRRYRTRSGWLVWAGRNNKENDLLTHRMADSDDFWFHASGYAGSHVVLRREGRRDEPSADTLVDAAAVAAYWSRGRSAKKVPVVYTLVKHVSKPRGSPPGLALPRRVRSLIVEPSLLPEQEAADRDRVS